MSSGCKQAFGNRTWTSHQTEHLHRTIASWVCEKFFTSFSFDSFLFFRFFPFLSVSSSVISFERINLHLRVPKCTDLNILNVIQKGISEWNVRKFSDRWMNLLLFLKFDKTEIERLESSTWFVAQWAIFVLFSTFVIYFQKMKFEEAKLVSTLDKSAPGEEERSSFLFRIVHWTKESKELTFARLLRAI